MVKWIKIYICWRCKDARNRALKLRGESLIKRVEEEGHIDYVCPKCDSVIICCKEVKK